MSEVIETLGIAPRASQRGRNGIPDGVGIPLQRAVLCVQCEQVSISTGECCAACGFSGGLLSLARVLNPTPQLGRITFITKPTEFAYDYE